MKQLIENGEKDKMDKFWLIIICVIVSIPIMRIGSKIIFKSYFEEKKASEKNLLNKEKP